MEELEINVGNNVGDFEVREYVKYGVVKERLPDSTGSLYHIRIDRDIEEPDLYRQHFDVLREATSKDSIIIYINSYGGRLDTAIQYLYALTDTKASTKAIIYTAVSAATLIAFVCDVVEAKPLSTIMLHNFSAQQQGKGSELRAKVKFDGEQFSALCNTVYSGILTPDEIQQLQEDNDFWMMGSELHARMETYLWEPIRGC